MLRGPLHDRGAEGRCTECGEYYPCRTATKLLVKQRDQQETDRLRANAVDQFETADILPRPGEVGARAERLAEALRAAGAPEYIVWNARRGVYDQFVRRGSTHAERT
jgi:hypothetical protein